jgi:hypothetical protein
LILILLHPPCLNRVLLSQSRRLKEIRQDLGIGIDPAKGAANFIAGVIIGDLTTILPASAKCSIAC